MLMLRAVEPTESLIAFNGVKRGHILNKRLPLRQHILPKKKSFRHHSLWMLPAPAKSHKKQNHKWRKEQQYYFAHHHMFDTRLLSRPSASKQRFVWYVALDRVQSGAESTAIVSLPRSPSSCIFCRCMCLYMKWYSTEHSNISDWMAAKGAVMHDAFSQHTADKSCGCIVLLTERQWSKTRKVNQFQKNDWQASFLKEILERVT